MPDNRKQLVEDLISLIDQHGSRRVLAERSATTVEYLSMICRRKRFPQIQILIGILNECGYELKIEKSVPYLVHEEK